MATTGHEAGAPAGTTWTPDSPAQLSRSSWIGVLKRTATEFKQDNVTDWAAALTYYGIQAMFPALIALVAVVGLVGHSATQALINNIGTLAPGTGRQVIDNAIRGLENSRGTAGVVFVIGILGALWSASGYVAAFMRASNSIYDIEEGRPIWKTIPVRVALTVVLLALLAISSFAVVVTGGLARSVGNLIGVGSAAVSVWDIAKWPVLVLIVSLMFSILYYAAPNVKHAGFKWVSPGGMLGVLIWIIASGLFALYVASFSSYNKTYGALAGVIIFLVWLWITNVALLFGAEFNAELERGRQIEAGLPADQEPFAEPRQAARG